jgi:hypothetical protein
LIELHVEDNKESFINSSAVTFRRDADETGSTDRVGWGQAADSSLSEQSNGGSYVETVNWSYKHLGAEYSEGMGDFTVDEEELGEPSFDPEDLPEAVAVEQYSVYDNRWMNTIGTTHASGFTTGADASSQADYRQNTNETIEQLQHSTEWAFADENGELGEEHHRILSSNVQSGAVSLWQRNSHQSENVGGVNVGTLAIRNTTLQYLHSDYVLDDDGEVTRSVLDRREFSYGGVKKVDRTGYPDETSYESEYRFGGTGLVRIETVTTGGVLTTSGTVSDPDQIVQHVEKTGQAGFEKEVDIVPATGPAWHSETDFDSGGSAEWYLTYSRPDPEDPYDTGLSVGVVEYAVSSPGHHIEWVDADAGYTGLLSFEGTGTGGITLTGPNEIHWWWNDDYIHTYQTAGSPPTLDPVTSGTGGDGYAEAVPETHPVNSFAATSASLVMLDAGPGPEGGFLSDVGVSVVSPLNTWSLGTAAPIAYNTQLATTHAADGSQPNTPVPDVPVEPLPVQSPAPDQQDEDSYYDQPEGKLWVGEIIGLEVERNGNRRTLDQVAAFDAANPNATSEDWDEFFRDCDDDDPPYSEELKEYWETMETVQAMASRLKKQTEGSADWIATKSQLDMMINVANTKATELGLLAGKANSIVLRTLNGMGDQAAGWDLTEKYFYAMQYAYNNGLIEGEIRERVGEMLEVFQNPEAAAEFAVKIGVTALLMRAIRSAKYCNAASGALAAGEAAATTIKVVAAGYELSSCTFTSEIKDQAERLGGLTADILEDAAVVAWINKWICFPAGTLVLMVSPDGERFTKPIEDVQVGDLVLAREEYGNTTQPRRVVDTIRHLAPSLIQIRYSSDDGSEHLIECTDEHPFWVANRERIAQDQSQTLSGEWSPAKELQIGDVLTGVKGQDRQVISVGRTNFDIWRQVYNFTVEGDHTYFVAPPDDPHGIVLAHNAKTCATGSKRYGKYKRRADDYKHALDPDHVKAAAKEKKGQVVARRPDGKPYDHLTETRANMVGARDRILHLKQLLAESTLDPSVRSQAESELGELSRLLDNARQILGE